MELRREQASACPRASSCTPSLCHLLMWHTMPELDLALLPSPLLPFRLLSVFFYGFVLFFFPLLCLCCSLHSGSPRGDLPQHGQARARASPRHRWVPLLQLIFLHYTLILWSCNTYRF